MRSARSVSRNGYRPPSPEDLARLVPAEASPTYLPFRAPCGRARARADRISTWRGGGDGAALHLGNDAQDQAGEARGLRAGVAAGATPRGDDGCARVLVRGRRGDHRRFAVGLEGVLRSLAR